VTGAAREECCGTMSERIAAVRARIAAACDRAGRDPAQITLVAVSKTFPAEAVVAAAEAGVRDFGENRVQEGAVKVAAVGAAGVAPCWHLIGHLQTNKVRAALDAFAILHAVDSERLLRAIAAAARRPARIMVEVNAAGEATKFGVAPGALAALLDVARTLPSVTVEGLMTVAPRASDPGELRPLFARMRALAAANGLRELSMGMSDDYEVAIEEGSTHVRIGRAIFGARA